jgi:hypothetical protein
MTVTSKKRLEDLIAFYTLLEALERKLGGARKLADCTGRMNWPKRGVYFFRENGEQRSDTGEGPRVVRIGTHGLKARGRATLWSRLSGHRGNIRSGGGNHRGSIFRLIVGTALLSGDEHVCPTWDDRGSADREIRASEIRLERAVSSIIREMPFLWVAIDDDPSPASMRGRIERNSIALLSNFKRTPLDPPSSHWLGNLCDRDRVRLSGLWNQNHVDEDYDPSFLDDLERLVSEVR